jgi:hypothetical protein
MSSQGQGRTYRFIHDDVGDEVSRMFRESINNTVDFHDDRKMYWNNITGYFVRNRKAQKQKGV